MSSTNPRGQCCSKNKPDRSKRWGWPCWSSSKPIVPPKPQGATRAWTLSSQITDGAVDLARDLLDPFLRSPELRFPLRLGGLETRINLRIERLKVRLPSSLMARRGNASREPGERGPSSASAPPSSSIGSSSSVSGCRSASTASLPVMGGAKWRRCEVPLQSPKTPQWRPQAQRRANGW